MANPLPLHGTNPEEVIRAIKARIGRSGADRMADGRKLGLIFEGGAMRAASAAGGAVALGHLGCCELFDEVYATSAGVMNASYFLSGQVDMGIRIYFEDLTTGRFVNPFRLWKVLDVDYVINHVVSQAKPLDVNKVLSSRTRFFVVVIDKSTGQGKVIDTKNTKAPLLDVLKAALSMPVFYNRTVSIDSSPCMDGGLRIPFALQQAIDSGCTDILVLLSRTADYLSPKPRWPDCFMFDLICARGRAGVNDAYADHDIRSKTARDLALGRVAPSRPVNIASICTEEPELIQRMTADPKILRASALQYGRNTMKIFGQDGDAWDFLLTGADAL